MIRIKRLLKAALAGIAAVIYAAVLGIIAERFGPGATVFFIVFTVTTFVTYIASWVWAC